MADVVCLGELLIDFVPTETGRGLIDAAAFKKAPGGAPANVAVGLRRLGTTSAFMGMVGDDPFGHFLAETLAADGVDVSALRFSAKARTALAFVSLHADGEREFLFYRHPSADILFAPADVDTDAIARGRLLHFGSISLIGEPSRGATLRALAAAGAAGTRISYDPNLRLPLWPDAKAARFGLRLGLTHADIVKISDEEVAFLADTHDPVRGGRSLWHDRLALMVITHGRQGCTWLTADADGAVPGFPVTAVDATGAGDAFMAGLLAGLLQEPQAAPRPEALTRICRFACAVGALTTTTRGAIPALPTRAAVDAFLATGPGG